jgi:threonine/homoserine/homoserine lactone efflux protein
LRISILIFYFLRGATLGLSAMATPGPFQAFLLAQTLKNGWRRTLPASLAPLVGDGPIIALVLLVLTQTPDWFLSVLQILGGLFILYLARGAFLAAKTTDSAPVVSEEAAHQNFFKAVLMNTLSPGPYLFWSVIAGPIVVEGWRQLPALGLSFVLGFYVTLIGGFASFVILFATASQLGPKVNKILSGVSAVALLGFGLFQLWRGVGALVG